MYTETIKPLSYSLREAGTILGARDPSTVKGLVEAGSLKAYRVGRRMRVLRESVAEYVACHAVSYQGDAGHDG